MCCSPPYHCPVTLFCHVVFTLRSMMTLMLLFEKWTSSLGLPHYRLPIVSAYLGLCSCIHVLLQADSCWAMLDSILLPQHHHQQLSTFCVWRGGEWVNVCSDSDRSGWLELVCCFHRNLNPETELRRIFGSKIVHSGYCMVLHAGRHSRLLIFIFIQCKCQHVNLCVSL